jgi:23S rRNA (uracil1939-C5)-methyltransferase
LIQPGDTVIVDPPRKGLDAGVVARLGSVRVRRLIYLSCHLASFLRDARSLRELGYELSECRVFGFLPFTEHIETLACFA